MKFVIALFCLLLLAGCQSNGGSNALPAGYVQACGAFNVAYQSALQLRIQGRLTSVEIADVDKAYMAVAPLCTGALPMDRAVAQVQILSAVATLTTMEQTK